MCAAARGSRFPQAPQRQPPKPKTRLPISSPSGSRFGMSLEFIKPQLATAIDHPFPCVLDGFTKSNTTLPRPMLQQPQAIVLDFEPRTDSPVPAGLLVLEHPPPLRLSRTATGLVLPKCAGPPDCIMEAYLVKATQNPNHRTSSQPHCR